MLDEKLTFGGVFLCQNICIKHSRNSYFNCRGRNFTGIEFKFVSLICIYFDIEKLHHLITLWLLFHITNYKGAAKILNTLSSTYIINH